ncbi:hypothetical protein [Streptomyces sp. NPDC012510]|uniref:hypothetical protein n=1 Tax=Streptomyces sp. NPDC012510 TaxID=3364838 RepID=UPI0036EB1916
MALLGGDDLGEVGEVELEGGGLDGPADPEPVGDADLVVVFRHPAVTPWSGLPVLRATQRRQAHRMVAARGP